MSCVSNLTSDLSDMRAIQGGVPRMKLSRIVNSTGSRPLSSFWRNTACTM